MDPRRAASECSSWVLEAGVQRAPNRALVRRRRKMAGGRWRLVCREIHPSWVGVIRELGRPEMLQAPAFPGIRLALRLDRA
jgi:hypothetical protein